LRELVSEASGSWVDKCLNGDSIEYIAEHLDCLQPQGRLDSFASLLLELGNQTQVVAFEEQGQTLLSKAIGNFWNRFPEEVFTLLHTVVRRSVGGTGMSTEAHAAHMVLAIRCVTALWEEARRLAGGGQEEFEHLQKAFLGLPPIQSKVPSDFDELDSLGLVKLALKALVLPLMYETLLCLSVKDADTALEILPKLQASQLWVDAFSSAHEHAAPLKDLDWYLELQFRNHKWLDAFSRCGVRVDQQSDESLARDEMLEWARMRLSRDEPLLELVQSKKICDDAQWEEMRRTLAYRVLELLLSAFEQACDFDGATHDLAVVVAQSPWMLQLVSPPLLRSFLQRIALIPLRLDGLSPYYAAADALPSAVGSAPAV